MPLLKNAKKALRASIRKAKINSRSRSQVKTATKAVTAGADKETISTAYSAIDRASKRNLIHRNKAARLKSQMSKRAAATA